MRKQILAVASLVLAMFLASFSQSKAQTSSSSPHKTITHLDSLFWVTYNQCDTERMKQFISEDLEFYHDKGGITLGQEGLLLSVKTNLCGNENFKVRREAVEGTIKVYPMYREKTAYGAIVSGDHYFYTQEKGKNEIRAGLAKFSNLWLLKDGIWKMTRILSYDHGPAPYLNTRKAITLPTNSLARFAGTYAGGNSGELTIKKENNALYLFTNGQKIALHPETTNRFFVLERDLTFEFVKNQEVSKMVVRENGEVVEEAVALRK